MYVQQQDFKEGTQENKDQPNLETNGRERYKCNYRAISRKAINYVSNGAEEMTFDQPTRLTASSRPGYYLFCTTMLCRLLSNPRPATHQSFEGYVSFIKTITGQRVLLALPHV